MDPSQFATKQELKDVETNLTHRMDLMEANLDARFEEVNTKFEKVNTRFEGVNTQFESVNTKIEKSKNSLIIWYIGTNIVLVGVILAAIRFMI
ncbi:hypothetical protein [Lentilactobacillus kisonensis]|nr:hypothetical protein [Lentilactobacillus kisonensis]